MSTPPMSNTMQSGAESDQDGDYAAFKATRWMYSDGEPVCPRCSCAAIYAYKTRKIYKCKACSHQFSDTSGTGFHGRKASYAQLIKALDVDVNIRGAATMISERAAVTYKTAHVLRNRISSSADMFDPGRFHAWKSDFPPDARVPVSPLPPAPEVGK